MCVRNNNLFSHLGLIIVIFGMIIMHTAGESSSEEFLETGDSITSIISSIPEEDKTIFIGVIAPLSETSTLCSPDNPCLLSDYQQYQDELGARQRAYLHIISGYAPDSLVAFYPVKNSDVTTRITGIQALLSSGADIIIEDIGSAYSPFMKGGALSNQVSQVLSSHPEVIIGGLIHEKDFNVDILPQGIVTFNLQWNGRSSEGKNAVFYQNLIDKKTGKNLGLGSQSYRDDGTFSSDISYWNQGTDTVRSEIQVETGIGTTSENTRLFAQITPENVFIDEAVFFPEKRAVTDMTQPEFIFISGLSERGISPDFRDTFSSEDVLGLEQKVSQKTDAGTDPLVSSGPVLLISALAPIHSVSAESPQETPGFNPGADKSGSFYGESMQWVFDLLFSIKDQIVERTIELTSVQPDYTMISGPVVLSKPGKYQINSDIISTDETIIEIRSSGVTINGNGHIIEGRSFLGGVDGPIFQTGVSVDTGQRLSGIVIENIGILGTYQGIRVHSATDIRIAGCFIDATTEGIVLDNSEDVTIDSCQITASESSGIVISEMKNTAVTGNVIEGGVNGIVISDSEDISLVSNEITDTIYEPVLEEGTNSNIALQE